METENDGYGFLNVPRHGYQDVSVNTVVLFQMFPKDKTWHDKCEHIFLKSHKKYGYAFRISFSDAFPVQKMYKRCTKDVQKMYKRCNFNE
jgi:hypothetical protein